MWELLIDAGYDRFRNFGPEEIKDELLVDLGLDSMGLLNLMIGIETEFGLEWRINEVNTITLSSLSTIASFILMEAHNEVVQNYAAAQESFAPESYFEVRHQAVGQEQFSIIGGR